MDDECRTLETKPQQDRSHSYPHSQIRTSESSISPSSRARLRTDSDPAPRWRSHPSLTTVLVSRFILDLQEVSHNDMKLDPDDPLHFETSGPGGLPSFVRAAAVEDDLAFGGLKLPVRTEVDSEAESESVHRGV